MTIRADDLVDAIERDRARTGRRAPRSPAATETREQPAPSQYLTLLEAIDAVVARRYGDDADGRYALARTFVVLWTALGYGLWVLAALAARLVAAIVRALTPRRKERS